MKKTTEKKVAIEELMTENANVSLRKVALAVGISYNVLLNAAKKPIAGTVYDPNVLNYEAIQEKLDKHEVDLSKLSLEDIVTDERSAATTVAQITVDTSWTMRGSNVVFTVVALTASHICLKYYDKETDEVTLRAMSLKTFLHQTPKEYTIPEELNTEVEEAV